MRIGSIAVILFFALFALANAATPDQISLDLTGTWSFQLDDSLCTPNRFDLSDCITPGRHRLTLRIDNRLKINVSHEPANVKFRTKDDGERFAADGLSPILGGLAGDYYERRALTRVDLVLPFGKGVKLWDEFTPNVYPLNVELTGSREGGKSYSHVYPDTFGLRKFVADGNQLKLNGRTVFLRGNQDNCIHSKTAYPPMTKAQELILTLRMAGSEVQNEWSFWVFPAAVDVAIPESVMFAECWSSQSQETLDNGGSVLLMQDGDLKTFWHTRFAGGFAKPPHYVVLEVPAGTTVVALSYSAWTGGNGNGHVKAHSVTVSEDGKTWGAPLIRGSSKPAISTEQQITFPTATTKRFIKFEVTDAVSHGGQPIAAIGELDV